MRPDAAPGAAVVARRDPGLVARVTGARPVHYAAGADAALDRPAHVRAGSGLARVRTPAGERLAVVQDDAHFLALVDPATALADAVTLPAGVGGRRQFDAGRGNKHHKLDLEACVALDAPDGGGPVLLAFGSGSTAARERVAVVGGLGDAPAGAATVRLADASALYAALRAERAFAGAQLNVEGAARVATDAGEVVRLFARGNGAGNAAAGAAGATCDLDAAALLASLTAGAPPPRPAAVTRYDLGTLGGERLGFTDAARAPDGRLLYLAAAESSADVVADGLVAGSALGVLDPDGGARWAPIVDAAGAPFLAKAEGLAFDGAGRLWAVLDVDDPDAPSLLCALEVGGLAGR